MGASWRIGIDRSRRTELVQAGVFGVSRNPIFLGMRVTLLGLFLVLPNALSLAVLVLGEALVQIQVRLEETHLASLHPEDCAAYRVRVRRWL
jgi:protein-S-isoprenylcysteine O-methyltransferase Ste14